MTSDSSQNEDRREAFTEVDYSNAKTKILNAGYLSPKMIVLSSPSEIAKKLGITLNEAKNISLWATRKLQEEGFMPPTFSIVKDLYKNIEHQTKLTTGCTALDKMLEGGIETGVLTQFYGASGVGKTQVCYNLCFMVQQPIRNGGLEGKAIYVDTESKFSPERMMQIANARKSNDDNSLDNIFASNAITVCQQEAFIENIPKLIEQDPKIKLVIVDSIINLYRREFIGRETLPERQTRLLKSVGMLAKISQLYKIAVVITNHTSSSVDSYSMQQVVPAGGNALAHNIKHKILLYSTGKTFLAKLTNSSSLPIETARFAIDQAGIIDIIRKTHNF